MSFSRSLMLFVFGLGLSLSVVGCGPKYEGPSEKEAPPTPEAGSDEYEAYKSGSKDGPGGAHGGPGGAHGG
jgi:hypothetical protein